MPESDIYGDITDYLERICGLLVFTGDDRSGHVIRRTRRKGLPDFFGCLPGGRWWAVEVKRDEAAARHKPKDRAKQRAVLESLRNSGALVIIATKLEDVIQAIPPGSKSRTSRRNTCSS